MLGVIYAIFLKYNHWASSPFESEILTKPKMQIKAVNVVVLVQSYIPAQAQIDKLVHEWRCGNGFLRWDILSQHIPCP